MVLRIYLLFTLVAAHEAALAGMFLFFLAVVPLCFLIWGLTDSVHGAIERWGTWGKKWSTYLLCTWVFCLLVYIFTPSKEAAITIIAADAVESGALSEATRSIAEAMK